MEGLNEGGADYMRLVSASIMMRIDLGRRTGEKLVSENARSEGQVIVSMKARGGWRIFQINVFFFF